MKFGVFLPISGPSASKSLITETAKQAQALGFDSVIVHDRVVQTRELHERNVVTGSVASAAQKRLPMSVDSFITLSYLAGVLDDLELGVSALVLPARHPLLVAKQAAALSYLSGGRFILGVCKGQRRIESTYNSLGLPFKRRWSMFKEYAEALRELLTKDNASYHGRYVEFSDVEIHPKPSRSRILMGVGISPPGIEAAARIGDGWLPGHRPPDEVEAGLSKIKRERRKMGLPSKYEVGLNLYTGIAKTQKGALKLASNTVLQRARLGTFPGSESDVVYRRALVGSPDYIIRRVEEYQRAGVQEIFHMMIYDTSEQLGESLKLLSRDVFPSFKSR